MFRVNVVCYPWDLQDEGIDTALDRLQGHIGVTGLTVVAATAPVRTFRVRTECTPRLIDSRGGFLFLPDESHYRDTRFKPVVSDQTKTRNPLSKIADECNRRDMPVRFLLDTRRIGRIVARHEDAAVKNACADTLPFLMCANNPDVAALLRGAVTDLSFNYTCAGIELRYIDRQADADAMANTTPLDRLPPSLQSLSALCFCESCRQQAGRADIDPELAAQSVRSLLDAALQKGDVILESSNDLLGDHPVLAAYLQHGRRLHADLLRSLADRSAGDLVIHQSRPHQSDLDGFDPVTECADCLMHALDASCFSESDGESIISTRPANQSDQKIGVQIPMAGVIESDPACLVRLFQSLQSQGITDVTLSHLGVMGDSASVAARQAIRFARRTAAI